MRRIDAGTYGICEISGQPLPRERLEALPAARYTIECQEKVKRQQKSGRSRAAADGSIFELRSQEEEEEDEDELPIRSRKRGGTLSQRIGEMDSSRNFEQILAD